MGFLLRFVLTDSCCESRLMLKTLGLTRGKENGLCRCQVIMQHMFLRYLLCARHSCRLRAQLCRRENLTKRQLANEAALGRAALETSRLKRCVGARQPSETRAAYHRGLRTGLRTQWAWSGQWWTIMLTPQQCVRTSEIMQHPAHSRHFSREVALDLKVTRIPPLHPPQSPRG